MALDQDVKDWQFERLKHALQALAAPPEIQLGLFPDFAVKSDELALDFDHFRQVVLSNYSEQLETTKVNALHQLDRYFEAPEQTVWSDEALKTDPFWANVRVLAADALNAFGWPLENPPDYRHEFIPSQPDA